MKHKRAGSLLLAGITIITGCGQLPSRSGTDNQASNGNAAGELVVNAARLQIGSPYLYGGESPAGFDCSGLVQYAYRQAGIEVPRSTEGQLRSVSRITLSSVRPGDVLFFKVSPPKISHVGIYIGDDRFVHAPSSGKTVSYGTLDNPYWKNHLAGAGRFY